MGVILLSRNKKTDEKSRGRHAMPEENNKKNNDKYNIYNVYPLVIRFVKEYNSDILHKQ